MNKPRVGQVYIITPESARSWRDTTFTITSVSEDGVWFKDQYNREWGVDLLSDHYELQENNMTETRRFKDGDYVLLEDIKTYCEKYNVDQEALEQTIIELFDACTKENLYQAYITRDASDVMIGINEGDVGYWFKEPQFLFNRLSVEDVLGITEVAQTFGVGDYVEVVSKGDQRAEVGMKGFVKSTMASETPEVPTECQMVMFESDCGITIEMYNGRFKHIAKVVQDDTIVSPEIKQALDELDVHFSYSIAEGFGLYHECLGDEDVHVQTKEEMLELFGAIRTILKFTQV